jgi:predicted transcriptional regulator
MTPERMKQLKAIAERNDETTAMYVANVTGTPLKRVNLSIKRFAELGLITPTGGGYFCISEKGKKYLEELRV